MVTATWSPIAIANGGATDNGSKRQDDCIDHLLTLDCNVAPTRAMLRLWPQELKNQRKMQLHCKRMERFRNRRKAEHERMIEEHRRLEQELETLVATIGQEGRNPGSEAHPELQCGMQRLVLEREMLRDESVVLRERIADLEKYVRIIQNASLKLDPLLATDQVESTSTTTTVRREASSSRWQPVEEQAGWLVHFAGGEPSFFFHPFSREEFDAAIKPHLDGSVTHKLNYAGKFLGWEVHHAPLIKKPASDLLIGRTRYCKRLQCSIENIRDAMRRKDGTSEWPLLPSARNLGLAEEIQALTLQQLDEESSVVVRNYPGEMIYRYLGLVQREVWEEDRGKRVLKYSLVIADSVANARSQDAEPTVQQSVSWVKDGGAILTLTESDDGGVDVSFEHWAACQNEQRAQSHFVTFGGDVTRWEQLVSPPNLLKL
ncbi:hypothetical protein PHYBOEH_001300 [Phytophthora boehmeriae]|uniref:Uncharacterized protein n=1 Tax=Phytophthora boehmeriae TaxID=109152 RepID=A0A8T1WUE5_9STRA|nr:hypothetical protein PHYBOEH_001300 [Phytophthora boehmeriae]